MEDKIARIKAMVYLYNADINNSLDLDANFIKEKCNEQLAYSIIIGTLLKLDSIDFLINKYITNYSLNRLNYVTRSIVRSATYELVYTDAKPEVVIATALDLCHEYTELEHGDSSRLVNSLLDKIYKETKDGRS